MSERVKLSVSDGLARIHLCAGDRHNAIDPLWVQELGAAVSDLRATQGVRALLIDAAGPSFTVGGDLNHFTAAGDDLPGALASMVEPFHRALADLDELEIPVLTAAQGAAGGGGLGLLYVADVVLAADSLRVATGFARLGLSGDGGSSWFLPRLVGLRRAQEMLFENRVLDAATALEWGLVTRVVPGAELARQAETTARALAAGPTVAYAQMRRLLRGTGSRSAREQLAAELAGMDATGGSTDARAGVAAFTARRAPEFTGQ